MSGNGQKKSTGSGPEVEISLKKEKKIRQLG